MPHQASPKGRMFDYLIIEWLLNGRSVTKHPPLGGGLVGINFLSGICTKKAVNLPINCLF